MKVRRTEFWFLCSIVLLSFVAIACAPSGGTYDEAATGDNASAEEGVAQEEVVAQEEAPAPAAKMISVTVPAGTALEVELLDSLSSGTNQVGDAVRAKLTSDLTIDGKRVATAGAELYGTVTEVQPLKKFGGQPAIAVAFEELDADSGETLAIEAWLSEVGKKQGGRDAAKIGGGAVAGAIVGHQVDDDKGSEIGALVGGAIGTAIAAKTGKEIEVPAGTMMFVVLEGDASARVAG